MKSYKGYIIEKLTRVDYIVRNKDMVRIMIPDGRWSFRTQREAKAFIDTL